jgi:hypothetical protein
MVFDGRPGLSTCGKIEKSTMPSVLSSLVRRGSHATKSSPIRGVITMLPPLRPTHTVFFKRRQELRETGLPHPVA